MAATRARRPRRSNRKGLHEFPLDHIYALRARGRHFLRAQGDRQKSHQLYSANSDRRTHEAELSRRADLRREDRGARRAALERVFSERSVAVKERELIRP